MKNLYKIENELHIVDNTKEIKEGNWLIVNDEDVMQMKSSYDNDMSGEDIWVGDSLNGYATYKDNCKKIILTTNQDLINDGVQPIDDEFLEWFCNNPSCEEVELMSLREIGRNEYEIIIPEEEPLYDYGWCKGNVILPKEETTLKLPSLPYEYKPLINKNQETLEENSFTLLEKELIKEAKKVWKEAHPNPIEMALFGAKWQQERLYTEEEVVNIAKLSYNNARVATGNHEVSFNMWFEQFKK